MRVLSFDVGLRNLAWCDLHFESSDAFQIKSWHVESAVDELTNVNETSIECLVPSFVKLLNEHFVDLDISCFDFILIESQPMGHGRSFGGTSFGGSPRNLKTKVLSHLIQAFFLQKGYDFSRIHFISPMLKLKDCPIPYKERSQKANKKQAIDKTAELIRESYQDLFVGTKRDDLADAFLQGQMVSLQVSNGSMKLEPSKMSQKKVAKDKSKDSKKDKTKAAKEKSLLKEKIVKKKNSKVEKIPKEGVPQVVDLSTEPESSNVIVKKEDAIKDISELQEDISKPPAKKRRVTKKQRTEAIAADFL